jgi:hypothetical protein
MDLKEICYEDGRWMEMAEDRVQWRGLVLAVLNYVVISSFQQTNCHLVS